jgi:hypothetical protein
LQPLLGNSLGATAAERVIKNRYVYEMSPLVPTDAQLKTEYQITATRAVSGDVTYKYEITQNGQITQILP